MKKFLVALTALAVAAPVAMPAPAFAQHHKRHHGDRHWDAADHYRGGKKYREHRLTRGDRIYRGRDGRYYCRRSDGTTGLIIGAALGGLLGNQIARGESNTVGTIIGAGAGALLGREISRGDVRCR